MAIDEKLVQAVWEKARGMPDRDQTEWRRDQCGAWLHRFQYNNSKSEYGWKILNVVAGGDDELENLQPFHWDNTFDIEHGRPQCRTSADRAGITPGQYVDQPRNTSA